MSTTSSKSAERRHLPQARSAPDRYEIAFPRRPPAASAISALFGALRDAFARGGDAVGDAYASSARVVLERKEALEDLNAERHHGGRQAAARALPAPLNDALPQNPRS